MGVGFKDLEDYGWRLKYVNEQMKEIAKGSHCTMRSINEKHRKKR